MDKLDKELLLLFEESDNIPKLNYIKENLKHHKLFKKFVKICIDFKIKLFDVIEDRYIVKNKEKLIKSVFQKRSEIIEKLAKSINNYNQLEKVVLSRKVKMLLKPENPDRRTDSSSPDETTFDIKAGIDKLYNEFKMESKLLDILLDLVVNTFQPEVVQSFYISKIKQTKYIEEYIS